MKALKRTIVFTQHKTGNKTITRPAAVFPNLKSATAYKSLLSAAHKSGDAAAVKALDATAPVDEAGNLFPGTLFAMHEVPYAPGIETPETEGDTFEL